MGKVALDTNLIVYSLIEGHPASGVCDSFIKDPRRSFYTTSLTPFEVYYALHRVYNVPRIDAASKALSLLEAPLTIVDVATADVRPAIERCSSKSLDVNDSLLIQMCVGLDIPSLASDDRRLLKACEEEGIQPVSPIDDEQRQLMLKWEQEKLPPSGLPRLLARIHNWMQQADPQVARTFLQATGNLRHMP
jgi:predicted nucleic acid-binding protein